MSHKTTKGVGECHTKQQKVGPVNDRMVLMFSKTCVKRPISKIPKNGFQDELSLYAGQKYCRMLQREHSAIFLPSISYCLSIRFFLSIFEWLFYTVWSIKWLLKHACTLSSGARYTQCQWKVTSKSHTLNIGQYLVHSERRTVETSTLNFIAKSSMHHHYGKRYPSHLNALISFLDGPL